MNYYDYHLASNKLHFIQKKLEEEKQEKQRKLEEEVQKNQEQQRKLEEEEQKNQEQLRKLEEEEQKNQEQQRKLKEKEQILQVSVLSKLILTVFNKRVKEKRCSFTLISFGIIIIIILSEF